MADAGQTRANVPGEVPPVTWTALLAHWTRFAQSAVALPREGEGGRWRACVPDIIALHALSLALERLDDLAPGERELGLDRAGVQVRTHGASIHAAWRGETLPDGLRTLIDEAFEAYRRAPETGVEWLAGSGGGEGAAPSKAEARVIGEAGVVVFALGTGDRVDAGVPVLFARGRRGGSPPAEARGALGNWARRMGGEADPVRAAVMRQVYRNAAGDLVVALDDTLPAGRPLLRAMSVPGS